MQDTRICTVARLKNNTVVFTKARKEKMDTQNNVKYVDLLKVENITRAVLKSVLLNMNDGLNVIHTKFLLIKELIIKGTKKKSLKSLKNQERKMGMQILKLIAKKIGRRSNVTTMLLSRLSLDNLSNLIFVKDVKRIVCHRLTTMITPNLWKLFGCVVNVMEKSIEQICQRERLNLWTPKGDAIVQTTEETCRGEFEAVPPPRNRSVSKLLLKVIEWLRHTAGCSFYQGQCITNDLWIQNLRSTGI
jgi:hypothetical protein